MKTDPGEGTEYTVNRRKRVGVVEKERERVQLHFESCGWGFVLCAGRAGDWEETDRDNRKACTAADGDDEEEEEDRWSVEERKRKEL